MKRIAKKIYNKLLRSSNKTPYSCSVCENESVTFNRFPDKYLRNFDKSGFEHSIFLFETLNIFQYSCAKCGAPDRDRLYTLYLNELFKEIDKEKFKLLDIAPTSHLTDFILKRINKENYRTADLYMEPVDDKIDIQKMDIYPDDSWDFVICSHVLEHVEDDLAALKEIYRVLKPNGKALLMAPINLGLKESIEAEKGKEYTDEERWRYFGQDDHMRLYSKRDFISKIESVGFKLHLLDVKHFGHGIFEEYGISERSVLYIGEK